MRGAARPGCAATRRRGDEIPEFLPAWAVGELGRRARVRRADAKSKARRPHFFNEIIIIIILRARLTLTVRARYTITVSCVGYPASFFVRMSYEPDVPGPPLHLMPWGNFFTGCPTQMSDVSLQGRLIKVA